ncbi:hypothetical protein RZE82_05745 [Mollicutes bacterium LVI A0039]|nr:hypothetical protein RZE82_05745 [Mollicutes bacterium LVI A0039]
MKKIKFVSLVLFAISCCIYVVAKASTYSTSYNNLKLEDELMEITTKNDELQIQLTTNLSRTELMEKYPDLTLNDNIFYIEEEA